MVTLDAVRASNAALVKSQPLVAVFVGSTSGIGSYAVKALAKEAKEGQGLRAYVVGRNRGAGEEIISDCLKVCPTGDFRFIRAENLALLSDVDRVCEEIFDSEQKEMGSSAGEKPRIDLLVMTQAYLAFTGRTETKEGLDELMSLIYYSRMRFIAQLIPLLLESPLPAHVISVFGPQRDEQLFLDDMSLRNPKNYNFGSMGSHAAYMKTFQFEHLAEKYKGKLAFIHYYPGLVVTDAFTSSTVPVWFKWAWRCVLPLVRPFTVTPAESGERVIFLASNQFPAKGLTPGKMVGLGIAESSDGVVGGGAYRVNWNGEKIPIKKNYEALRRDGWPEKFRAHTQQAFADIEAEKVFSG